MPISFLHAARADQVKRDFLESASNSAIFFSAVSDSLYLLAMGVLLAWDSQCHDHKPELNVV